MNKDIEILPSEVVNQIAAGEVIERPSHLVKELVENSLDAGAAEIEVEFALGGKQVKVRDNGCGMSKKNLSLSLMRYATSKIRHFSDIWSLNSYGFRGEALASIAAVSQITVVSKTWEQDSAYQLDSQFGKFEEPFPTGSEIGTTIVMSRLFENTPARLKFLKSDAAESSQIKNVLKAMAMAYPHVQFRIRQNGKLLFYWPACENRKLRVEQVLEQDTMYKGTGVSGGIRTEVVISSPNNCVKTRRQMWLFVQNRWVQDSGIQAAVMDAYRNLLMHGEYPIVAVWVHCDSDEIDVNIHPAKSQVKFRQSADSFKSVSRAVRGCLEKAPWLETLDYKKQTEEPWSAKETIAFEGKTPYQLDFKKGSEWEQTQWAQKEWAQKDFTIDQKTKEIKRPEVSSHVGGGKAQWSQFQVLGQANLTYIVTQSDHSLVLVDQHAAHERVVFEELMQSWSNKEFKVQQLLLPEVVSLSQEFVQAILEIKKQLLEIGLFIERVNDGEIQVKASPALIKPGSLAEIFEKLASDLLEHGGSFVFEKYVGELFATMACHSAIRAGQSLSVEEMKSLLVQMDKFPLSSFCPHGRPVYVEYGFSQLDREFGRIT